MLWSGITHVYDYRDSIVFEKLHIQNVFTRKRKTGVLKTDFEKLRIRDGLVWTVGQNVEIKLHFGLGLIRLKVSTWKMYLNSCAIEHESSVSKFLCCKWHTTLTYL